MAIFENIFSRTPKKAPKEQEVTYNGFSFSGGHLTKSGEQVSPAECLEDATVLSCINTIAQTVAQLPLCVLDNSGTKVVNRLEKVLNKPNNWQTTYTFKYSIVHSLLAYGNVYMRIIRTKAGDPVQLVLIEPTDITVAANVAGIPVYKHHTHGQIPHQDIIHIQDVSGFGAVGLSRVELAAERIGALKAADRLMAETFRNGVSMGYIAKVDDSMTQDEFMAMSQSFKESFGQSGQSRGGAAVVRGVDVQAIKGTTPADADLRALRETLIKEIAAIFKVPTSMVGGDGDAKYSNLRQSQTAFYRDTIAPILDVIEQSINLKLGSAKGKAKFDVSSLLKGDVESQSRVAVQLATAGIMTPNEARTYLGYEAIEGGDELASNGKETNVDDMRGSVDQPNAMAPENTGEE